MAGKDKCTVAGAHRVEAGDFGPALAVKAFSGVEQAILVVVAPHDMHLCNTQAWGHGRVRERLRTRVRQRLENKKKGLIFPLSFSIRSSGTQRLDLR